MRVVAGTDDPEGRGQTCPTPWCGCRGACPCRSATCGSCGTPGARLCRSDVVYINGIELPASLGALLARRPRVLKVVGDWAWESAIRRGLTTMGIEPFQSADAWGEDPDVSSHPAVLLPARQRRHRAERLRRLPGRGVGRRRAQDPGHPERAHQHAASRRGARGGAPERSGCDAPVVCNVSRLYAWKHVDALIRMVPRFNHGRHPAHRGRRTRAGATGASWRGRSVWPTGWCSPATCRTTAWRPTCGRAQICVLNTQYEGLSHTLVEARHVGTPIVTTDIGGNREILRHETFRGAGAVRRCTTPLCMR